MAKSWDMVRTFLQSRNVAVVRAGLTGGGDDGRIEEFTFYVLREGHTEVSAEEAADPDATGSVRALPHEATRELLEALVGERTSVATVLNKVAFWVGSNTAPGFTQDSGGGGRVCFDLAADRAYAQMYYIVEEQENTRPRSYTSDAFPETCTEVLEEVQADAMQPADYTDQVWRIWEEEASPEMKVGYDLVMTLRSNGLPYGWECGDGPSGGLVLALEVSAHMLPSLDYPSMNAYRRKKPRTLAESTEALEVYRAWLRCRPGPPHMHGLPVRMQTWPVFLALHGNQDPVPMLVKAYAPNLVLAEEP